MSPELAARVEASVTGRPIGRKASPRTVAIARILGLAMIVGVGSWLSLTKRRCNDRVDDDRAVLLDDTKHRRMDLSDTDRETSSRVTAWLLAHAGDFEGDVVANDLKKKGGLDATLARPSIYVRGPVEAFASSAGISENADASFADALVLCLVDPPEKRSDKTLVQRARAAAKGGQQIIGHVERLDSLFKGAPFLSPEWDDRIRGAKTLRDLARLRTQLNAAPIDAAKSAMKARLLLVAMDEPKVGDGPTEIDGAYAHYVRVALVDLDTNEALLRARKFVDPGKLSKEALEWASGAVSCQVGEAVRDDVLGPPK